MGHDDRTRLVHADLQDEGLDDWRLLVHRLHTRFATETFARGLALVAAIGEAAETADHHPDVDLSYPHVDVRLNSHDVGGVTARDVRLARQISGIAAAMDIRATPAVVADLELGLDTPDHGAIRPFWAALLGYATPGPPDDDQITDPGGRGPTIWFQGSAADPAVPSQRWHLDVTVPPEVAPDRIRACLDAGGRLVDDTRAPSFWVLADPQGNRACICTAEGRD